jgi:hypothetical protein
VRFSPRLPAERVANTNPILTEVAAQIDRGNGVEEPIALPSRRVHDGRSSRAPKVPAAPSSSSRRVPLDGSFETYVVPTFEGGSRTFTENLRYQWLATAGSWTSPRRDRRPARSGRQPAGDLEHVVGARRAPDGVARLVDLWVIQRDERGGASWLPVCAVVEPRSSRGLVAQPPSIPAKPRGWSPRPPRSPQAGIEPPPRTPPWTRDWWRVRTVCAPSIAATRGARARSRSGAAARRRRARSGGRP